MFDSKQINDLVKSLMDAVPPGIANLPKDMENNFRRVLHAAFNKMDLVTREEFDVQTKVLERTRAKLNKLEKALKELEKKSH